MLELEKKKEEDKMVPNTFLGSFAMKTAINGRLYLAFVFGISVFFLRSSVLDKTEACFTFFLFNQRETVDQSKKKDKKELRKFGNHVKETPILLRLTLCDFFL